ncbi:AraC family transcriptional regulator [Amycolatopsis suaedae]|nr:AraC family transcriptional regulator [Amycolatopsis suaedae]
MSSPIFGQDLPREEGHDRPAGVTIRANIRPPFVPMPPDIRTDPAIAAAGAEHPTVLASWTALVVRALDSAGFDGASMAVRAGIDPAVFEQPGRRIPLSATTTLWELAVDATGDPTFALSVARMVRPSTFAGLSMGMVTSSSLHNAFERLNRFQTVVLAPSGKMELTTDGDTYSWTNSFPDPIPAPNTTAMEALVASIVLCGRYLGGRSFAPKGVRLMRDDQRHNEVFTKFFGCPVTYGSDDYRLDFELGLMTKPLQTGSPELARTADELAMAMVRRLPSSTGLVSRVRALTLGLDVDGQADKTTIAAALAMSTRTLQRRLADEGTTLVRVMTEVRRDRASELLAAGSHTVAEVARQVGFQDPSSFRRAFKRWTGRTPAQFAAERKRPT